MTDPSGQFTEISSIKILLIYIQSMIVIMSMHNPPEAPHLQKDFQ